MVVFHWVCLNQVCLRSDDAKLKDNLYLMSKSLFLFIRLATQALQKGRSSNMAAPTLTAKRYREAKLIS